MVIGETCGASPHPPAGTLSLHPFSGTGNLYVASNVPVKQSNMHTYFCRERMCFCELGARTAGHAETPLQKEHCDFASWLRHCRPRAGRCETPPAGCCASGENEKKPAGKFTFLTGFFLHFHCARGLSFRSLKQHAEKSL